MYFAGNGPAILLIQELPGIDRDTFTLAEKLIGQCYAVYLPLLIGHFDQKAYDEMAAYFKMRFAL